MRCTDIGSNAYIRFHLMNRSPKSSLLEHVYSWADERVQMTVIDLMGEVGYKKEGSAGQK